MQRARIGYPREAEERKRSLILPGACVWDYSDGMQFLRRFLDAASVMDSAARELDEGYRFPLCRRDTLTALFRRADLDDVRCEAIEIPAAFVSFEDYWRPLLGATGPAPSYVASLDADRRAILARRLEETVGRGQDGAIALTARALGSSWNCELMMALDSNSMQRSALRVAADAER